MCSSRMPSYWMGISQPEKGTRRAPASWWRVCRGVRRRGGPADTAPEPTRGPRRENGAVRVALTALAAALALADSSVVTLGLPPLLVELDTTVPGAAAVLGVYTLGLTLAVLAGAAAVRRT